MTGIWRNTALERPPLKYIANFFFSQSSQGCKAVVHAATCPIGSAGSADAPPALRFYARGMLAAWPVTAALSPPLMHAAISWSVSLDQLLRSVTFGALGSTSRAVRAAPIAYDKVLAADLWNVSSKMCDLPADV